MNKQIPLSTPNLNLSIVENLKECIETGWVSTGGRFIGEFENKLASYVGMNDAVSTQSGTAGLHLALRALGVTAGDKVVVPTLTFVAAVNPVIYQSATPVFMDCDDTLCMNPDKLEAYLEQHHSEVKAIIVVHIFGNLANMDRIMEVAQRYWIPVIEDATEALGTFVTAGKYSGKYAGTIGDIGVYSFNANKIITTGGGGMIVSNDYEKLEKMRHLSITAKTDSLFFIHDEVGYNYRMLNLQAALGVSQLDEIETFIATKICNYRIYQQNLSGIEGLHVLPFNEDIRANHWFYSLCIDETKFGMNRDQLMEKLIQRGIQCRPIWRLIHKLKPYESYEAYQIEQAIWYERNVLNVPCSTNLTEEDVNDVCKTIIAIKKDTLQ